MKLGKINCIIVDDERVAREILESHLKRIEQVRVVDSCKNALEAFTAINRFHVDLVFLDIQMPDISGLSLARSMNRDLKIIFTTAFREYAVDCFDLMAVDYLLKPISFERLLQGINKYLEEHDACFEDHSTEIQELQDDFIFVRAERKMVKINFRDILFIESLSDYVKIRLDEHKSVVTRDTISNIESRLSQADFLRVHRSYIVSLGKIDTYTSDTIGMGRYEIPISRGFRESVMRRLGGDTRSDKSGT